VVGVLDGDRDLAVGGVRDRRVARQRALEDPLDLRGRVPTVIAGGVWRLGQRDAGREGQRHHQEDACSFHSVSLLNLSCSYRLFVSLSKRIVVALCQVGSSAL
jgi:hypothetical protein